MRMGAVQRGVHTWKNLLRAVILVVFNGMILSHSGLLSYTHISWQAFAQSYPLGGACASPTECLSGFCADGVCCNQACTQPGAVCDAAGAPGICRSPAPVPALSGPGQALAVLVLIGGAFLGWRLRPTD
ncbi:MAG: hypothetical protein ABI629_10665 [bacterium]